ncbi:MAG: ZIP family metal transporter [Metamycoplasmataceae bacterium]
MNDLFSLSLLEKNSNTFTIGQQFPMIAIIFIVIGFTCLIPWIYGFLLPVIKPTLSKKASIYLYSFSSGFFIILGIFGFLFEAKEQIGEWSHMNNISTAQEWGISIGILGGGLLLVLLSTLGLKYFISKKFNQKSLTEQNHDHKNDLLEHTHNHEMLVFNNNDINPKTKKFALSLILSHRIPGGLITGILISDIANSATLNITQILFLITFVLHIIPEELIFYYRQIEMGINKWKASFNSFLGTAILIPFIFIGAYSAEAISKFEAWDIISAFINVCVGGFFIFIAIVEFIPEYLHRKIETKTFYNSMIFLIFGIVICVIIFSLHSHPEVH